MSAAAVCIGDLRTASLSWRLFVDWSLSEDDEHDVEIHLSRPSVSGRGYLEQAVWLDSRFPLSLRMVEDLLAARGIIVSHETLRRRAEKSRRN